MPKEWLCKNPACFIADFSFAALSCLSKSSSSAFCTCKNALARCHRCRMWFRKNCARTTSECTHDYMDSPSSSPSRVLSFSDFQSAVALARIHAHHCNLYYQYTVTHTRTHQCRVWGSGGTSGTFAVCQERISRLSVTKCLLAAPLEGGGDTSPRSFRSVENRRGAVRNLALRHTY